MFPLMRSNKFLNMPLTSSRDRKPTRALLSLTASVFIILVWVTPTRSQERLTAGWIENVRIHPGNLLIRAKLDTGARHSSLNATEIKKFERHGENWIQFYVVDRRGKKYHFEQKVHRYAKIKEHGAAPDRRPVILLGICLGSVYKEVEVNLEDRSNFKYQLLLGRSFLMGSIVVDPSATLTTTPICQKAPKQ